MLFSLKFKLAEAPTVTDWYRYLELQLGVVSHENHQAVKGSQALGVGPRAGTP